MIKFSFFSILSIVLIITSCNSDTTTEVKKTFLQNENLKGKVYNVIENSYYPEYKFGDLKTGEKIQEEEEIVFSEDGKLLEKRFMNMLGNIFVSKFNEFELLSEKIAFNSLGEFNNKFVYRYDKNNNLLEEYSHDFESNLEQRTLATYDDNNNVTKVTTYEFDKLLETTKCKYVYDNKGNKLEMDCALYDSSGKLSDNIKDLFEYDKRGNLIAETRFNSKGDLEHKFTYKYDENENEIEFKNYTFDGRLVFTRLKQFDNSGILIKEEEIMYFDLVKEYNAQINVCNQIFSQANFLYDSEINRTTYEYDDFGNIKSKSEFRIFALNENIVFENVCEWFYDYEYDKYNNWVVKLERLKNENVFNNEDVVKITERKIEYYK